MSAFHWRPLTWRERIYHQAAVMFYSGLLAISRRVLRLPWSQATWQRMFDWELEHLFTDAYYHEGRLNGDIPSPEEMRAMREAVS